MGSLIRHICLNGKTIPSLEKVHTALIDNLSSCGQHADLPHVVTPGYPNFCHGMGTNNYALETESQW
eukprot:8958496-Pyramimonas_sp.AAC.2